MKTKIILKLILIIAITVSATYTQEITLTTSAANVVASRAAIDLPALSNNPDAIIVATPLGRTATLNPHPIGAWYYNGKWNIFNTDHATLLNGATFKVEVFLRPDANHFLHLVTKENLSGEGSYIDNPSLNGNPKAQFKILQNHAPENRSSGLNKFEAKAEYNAAAGKWAIKNVNNEPLYPNTAYNVVITSGGLGIINTPKTSLIIPELITNPQKTALDTTCNCPIPTSLPPDGNAGGDLSGTYPNPTVQKLAGRNVANVAPNVGDILRWNGTAWEPFGNALEPLKFNPSLGKKIILYPGQTGDVGFGVQGNLLQIHSDHPNADVAIGYDQAGTFNEKFRVKASGAIAVSGETGQNGQVLTSNGAGSPPTWKQPPTSQPTAPIQTFFKTKPYGTGAFNTGQQLTDSNPERKITELTHTIVLNKKSRLIISGKIAVGGPHCIVTITIACRDGNGYFDMKINNQKVTGDQIKVSSGNGIVQPADISNFMIDKEPGTYTIEFIVSHEAGTSSIDPQGQYSSVMVIPLE